MIGIALWALAIAAEPAPKIVAPPPKIGAARPASREQALALAQTVAPPDVFVALELEVTKKAFLALPTMDADVKAMEEGYPGILSAVWVKAEPDLRKMVKADLPPLWDKLAAVYINRLTAEQSEAVLQFYRSPYGQRLIRTQYGNVDFTSAFGELVRNEQDGFTDKQLNAVQKSATAQTMKDMGEPDMAALTPLMRAIPLSQFRLVAAETHRAVTEWMREPVAGVDEQPEDLFARLLADYIAEHEQR